MKTFLRRILFAVVTSVTALSTLATAAVPTPRVSRLYLPRTRIARRSRGFWSGESGDFDVVHVLANRSRRGGRTGLLTNMAASIDPQTRHELKTRILVLLAFVLPFSVFAADGVKTVPKAMARLSAPWPPPSGALRVIIDTDAANEVDDQWAIALALGFPERLKIEGFVAAHYGQRGGAKGIAKSRASIEATLAAAGLGGRFVLQDGSDPITYRDRVPQSAGVDFIIATARTATPENPVWLVLLGPATDGAAALLKAPDIADRLVIFWHGRSTWPERCTNFNATNDPVATQLLFELPCRFVLFDTGTGLTMPMEESEKRVGSVGALGRFIHDIRKPSPYARRADKGMFDLGDIAALIDPAGTATWETVEAPGVRFDLSYDFTQKKGPLLRIKSIDRTASFSLLDQSLRRIASGAGSPTVP